MSNKASNMTSRTSIVRSCAAAVLLTLAASTAMAAPLDSLSTSKPERLLPGTSLAPRVGSTAAAEDINVPIEVVARAYGDSVTLRWAIASYPEWRYLTRTGVDILRHDAAGTGFSVDTLARGVKPLSLDAFRSRYPDQADSLAYLAMGSLYGEGEMTPEETPYYSKSVEALGDVAEDQKMRIIGAFIAADRRPDLARALALSFTDHDVKAGGTYSYYVVPSRPDTTGHLFITNGMAERVKNNRYKPQPYEVAMRDSVSGHCKAVLSWDDPVSGMFEVYRRRVETDARGKVAKLGDWQKLSDAPYVPPFNFAFTSQSIIFADSVPEIGDYEYCVQAYDAFGDLTPKSATHRVHYPDLLPPAGPEISYIYIDRPDEVDPSAKIFAEIHFSKGVVEPDFTHYTALYYNERDSMQSWRLLTNQYIAPTDTMVRVDVTHVSTGMVTIAAVDTAGNMGYAMPRLMRVADLKPPSAPTNLQADAQLDGTIMLTWDMADTLDLRNYDVFFANSLDHHFVKANSGPVYSRSYMDTVAVDANERYIYYFVRGMDWNTNQGLHSDTLRVLRPNSETPSMAHLDTMWVDDKMIHIRWIGGGDEVISHYNVYRRKSGDEEWTLLHTLEGDSVKANGYVFQIDDAVEPDLHRGYEYTVQTVSLWGIESELTPVLTARLTGSRMIDFPLTLEGVYDVASKETKIAWDAGTSPINNPYFFCIYRKGPHDDGFNYITDAPPTERMYIDHLLKPGETAQYRLSVRFEDGRKGPVSNIITVTAPQ